MSKFYEIKNLRNSQNRGEDGYTANSSMIDMNDLPQVDTNKNTIQAEAKNNNSMNFSSTSFGNKQNKTNSKIEIDMNSDNEENPKVEPNKQEDIENRISIDAGSQKIFMTDYKILNFDNKDLFSFHDLIVPGGKNAKLCLINDPFNKNLRVTEIADHFKFYEPTPAIVLIGANTKRK